jgi:hypothetical protein
MKLLVLAVLASVFVGCGAAATCPATPVPVPPKKNELTTRACTVIFDGGLDDDARMIAGLTESATTAVARELAPLADGPMDPLRCRIHVFGFRSKLASEDGTDFSLMPQPPKGEPMVDIFYFAPSLYDPNSKSSAGQPKDADWWSLRVTGSVSNLLLLGITNAKGKGWRYFDAPKWFTSGYSEYLACTLSTAKGRAVVLPTYVARVKEDTARVKIGDVIETKKVWDDGAVLLAFLHDELGKKRVQSILTSPLPTFDAAFDEAIGPDRAALAAKFSAWLQKQP